eukprot:9149045-Lingulodinium_polyedra.AAC.1
MARCPPRRWHRRRRARRRASPKWLWCPATRRGCPAWWSRAQGRGRARRPRRCPGAASGASPPASWVPRE